MNNKESIEAHGERLKEVLAYLKTQGFNQKEIAESCCLDSYDISHLKSGTLKHIPENFLAALRKKYHINPEYIRGTSNIMLDVQGTMLEYFEKVVTDWDSVAKGQNQYLHLRMDNNFYKFLLDVSEATLTEAEQSLATKIKIEELKKLHSGTSDIKEYVLIPRNNFVEYLMDEQNAEKQLSEILDLSKMLDYLEE